MRWKNSYELIKEWMENTKQVKLCNTSSDPYTTVAILPYSRAVYLVDYVERLNSVEEAFVEKLAVTLAELVEPIRVKKFGNEYCALYVVPPGAVPIIVSDVVFIPSFREEVCVGCSESELELPSWMKKKLDELKQVTGHDVEEVVRKQYYDDAVVSFEDTVTFELGTKNSVLYGEVDKIIEEDERGKVIVKVTPRTDVAVLTYYVYGKRVVVLSPLFNQ